MRYLILFQIWIQEKVPRGTDTAKLKLVIIRPINIDTKHLLSISINCELADKYRVKLWIKYRFCSGEAEMPQWRERRMSPMSLLAVSGGVWRSIPHEKAIVSSNSSQKHPGQGNIEMSLNFPFQSWGSSQFHSNACYEPLQLLVSHALLFLCSPGSFDPPTFLLQNP